MDDVTVSGFHKFCCFHEKNFNFSPFIIAAYMDNLRTTTLAKSVK
jgi:hypothetical protein